MLGKNKAAALADPQGPPFPEPLEYIWLWFCQHSLGMASGGMAYPVITWEGLHAWAQLMHIELEAWESDLMVNLSCMRANAHAEQSLAERNKKA